MEITTIKVSKSTKERIDKLRLYRRETYDEILQSMLEILNLVRAYPERAKSKLIAIDRQRKKTKVNKIILQNAEQSNRSKDRS